MKIWNPNSNLLSVIFPFPVRCGKTGYCRVVETKLSKKTTYSFFRFLSFEVLLFIHRHVWILCSLHYIFADLITKWIHWKSTKDSINRGIHKIHIYCNISVKIYNKSWTDRLNILNKAFLSTLSFRYLLILEEKVYAVDIEPLNKNWHHLALVYGNNSLLIYHNGTLVGSDETGNIITRRESGNGRMVIGRQFTDRDEKYVSMHLDEVMMWNQALNVEEIKYIYSR